MVRKGFKYIGYKTYRLDVRKDNKKVNVYLSPNKVFL